MRYNTNGSLDTTFGVGGQVISDFGTADILSDAALQANGKIVVTGRFYSGSGGDDFAVVRYEDDGTLDLTFGSAGTGIVRTDIAGGSSDDARGIAVQADDNILVAGQSAFGTTIGSADFGIARYEGAP